ncbi:MAG: APC family permease, partial [Chloroflexi bacterium]|nr:APC family permease [Chloroflexota bacterium]
MTVTGPRGTEGPRLERRLGLAATAFSGIGIVLGAGIYVLVGEASGEAGSAVWLSFAVAAVLAGGTGLAFAELSSMIPEAGASSAYAREAFGPHVGFVTGWMDITVSVIGAAAVAIGFGGYLGDLFLGDATVIAVFVLLASGLIVYAGVRETVTLAVVFAALEAGGLVLVVVVGLPDLGSVDLLDAKSGLGGVLAATALVFFAYEGFEEIATLAEETRNPTRNIPLAIVIAVAVTSVLYVAVAAVAVSVVPWEQLAASDAPLTTVVEAATHDRLGDVLSTIALFATFNTVLLLLATGARLIYGMSTRRLLPEVMGRVSAARGTPWVATILVTAVALAFALTGDIGFVAQVTNFAVFVLFLAVNASLIRLRFTQPERPRPFRLRGTIARVPLIPVVAGSGTIALAGFMDREATVLGVGALLIGIALSVLMVRRETPA